MIKRKRLIASVVTMALLFGLMPYVLSTKPISKAADHGLSNPRVAQDNTVTWDCVYFGNYWQNDTNGDGKADQNDEKEPIKWRILSVDGDDAFLLADQNLDCQPYNEEHTEVTWETCTLRQWLNNDFYQNAFDSSEQSAVQTTTVVNEERNPTYGTAGGNNTSDKVYLLSIGEVSNTAYGFHEKYRSTKTRESKNTEYAKGCGGDTSVGNGYWWLRSPGNYSSSAADVFVYGYVNDIGCDVDNYPIVVRPALHLNLTSSKWIKADTVTATGGTFATPTPVITSTPTAKPTPVITSTPTAKPTPVITSTPTAKPTLTPSNTPRPTGLTRPTYPTPIRINPPIKPTETETPAPTVTPKPRTITAPSKPTRLKAINNKKKSVTLSWKRVKGATGYQIQYATNSAFAKKKLKTTKKTKMVIKKLKKKKSYSFRVRAYKFDNNVKVYGNWSKAKKIKIKK